VQQDMQQLPIYKELEFKLLQKELSLSSKDNEDWEVEALIVEGNVKSSKCQKCYVNQS
jgi:hypothetical protein